MFDAQRLKKLKWGGGAQWSFYEKNVQLWTLSKTTVRAVKIVYLLYQEIIIKGIFSHIFKHFSL